MNAKEWAEQDRKHRENIYAKTLEKYKAGKLGINDTFTTKKGTFYKIFKVAICKITSRKCFYVGKYSGYTEQCRLKFSGHKWIFADSIKLAKAVSD